MTEVEVHGVIMVVGKSISAKLSLVPRLSVESKVQ